MVVNEQAGEWTRVTRAEPCGICEKPDWCCRGEKGWNCMRVESAKVCKNGGWFHPFDSAKPPPPLKNPMKQPKPVIDCGGIMKEWWNETTGDRLGMMGRELGVSARALGWIRAAWAGERDAMAFPMYDGACYNGDEPCGIRLRTMDGKKFAVTGSKSGVFYPYGAYLHVRANRIFICEGPTDTAACLDLGLFAIGRASCRGGEDIILTALEQIAPMDCVVVCDNDGPGVEGADELLGKIKIPKTKFVPPGKDIRSFVKDGGTLAILDNMLRNLLRK